MQLSYFKAKLALLLNISQTRFGANAIINAGLFQSIRGSGLFSLDPDLGAGMLFCDVLIHSLTRVDIDGSESVETHYELLLAVMRVINSAILSRGEQNEQTLTEGRKFLSENRLSVLTVFKRSMNIVTADRVVSAEAVDDLADSYMLLITLTGFINVSTSFDDCMAEKGY